MITIDESVEEYLDDEIDPKRHAECRALIAMMSDATGEPAKMWGRTIGFGNYHYKYESGHEGDFFTVGFSVLGSTLAIYLNNGAPGDPAKLNGLGKFEAGKECLYIDNLAGVNLDKLRALVAECHLELTQRPDDLLEHSN